MLKECTLIHIGQIKSNTDVMAPVAFVCKRYFDVLDTDLYDQFSQICLAIYCVEECKLLVLNRGCVQ